MDNPLTSAPRRILILCFAAAAFSSQLLLSGKPDEPAPTSVDFEILEQSVTERKGRKIVLNRIAPPDLPERVVIAKPAVRKLAADERERMEARAAKAHVSLLVEATVYDRTVSELRWKQNGRNLRCWSNTDMNLFGAFPTVETEDTVFSFFILARNADRNSAGEIRIPEISDFSQSQADYRMVGSKNETWDAEALAAVEALHLFYEENEASLKNAYELWQVAREERERELRENPPSGDITIHFWPLQSRVSAPEP